MSAEPRPVLTEAAIQNLLYFYCNSKSHQMINPNSCLLGWESDLISITKAGYIHEFEIKISRSDFKADAKKARAEEIVTGISSHWYGKERGIKSSRPNYFYYVVPKDLIQAIEVPDYAGLIYVCPWYDKWTLRFAKRGTRIHDEKATEKQIMQMTRSLMYRYWRQRLKAV